MRQTLLSLMGMLLCAATVYGHDANADVMKIETSITFPDKAPIVLQYKANHLGKGETLEKLVKGTLGFPYPAGSIKTPVKLSAAAAVVEPGEHRIFVANDGGKMVLQIGGGRQGGGARVPMSLETAGMVLEHMQISVNHGNGDNDLKISFGYGKYRSSVVLEVK